MEAKEVRGEMLTRSWSQLETGTSQIPGKVLLHKCTTDFVSP